MPGDSNYLSQHLRQTASLGLLEAKGSGRQDVGLLNALSKITLLLRVELTLSPSQFHTACRVSFGRLHQKRRLPEASETHVNNADLEGISRCSRVVILEPPDS